MGNNKEIRQRMETYRSILLVLNWIGAIALIIVGIVLANSRYTQGIGIGVIIGSVVFGIIGHFLINVTLAIPFILLNNGDILESMKGNTGSSPGSNSNGGKPNENNKDENILGIDEFEAKYLKEIEDDKEIYESGLFQLDYKNLIEKLLMKYPVSIRRDIEKMEKKHGIETTKKVIIKMLLK